MTRTRVLVVDDHDLVAESLTRALRVEPDLYVVGSARSCVSALDMARALRPDVVVMDYVLPDGNGAQATALIKAELPKTEIVVLTGAANSVSLSEALEAGCSGFVQKEGRFDQLVHTIRAVVAGEISIPQDFVEQRATGAPRQAHGERERIEHRLQQSQRLESLGQLAGGVAHDFNNLIAVIVNCAAFVREEATANMDGGADAQRWEAVRVDIEQIEHAGERATQLTQQLLAFARRDALRPEVVDLNRVVGEVERLLVRTIGEHVEVAVSLGARLKPVVVDPGQIEQVLLNLALNARDAMPTGGLLTIATQNVTVNASEAEVHPDLAPGAYVRLRVSDTGPGMTPEVIGPAFEPFFTTKPRGEGSGLGLSTVYDIITDAGGHVGISSELGIGTTVTALLPATDAAVTRTTDAPARAQSVARGETILVVEDEDAMRELTRRMLARNGYCVLTAANGDEALALAREKTGDIQLLITDVVMPHMLGDEVAHQMREMRPDLPLLFMTGYAEPMLGTPEPVEPGVSLLEKPFSEPALLAKVREVLDTTAHS